MSAEDNNNPYTSFQAGVTATLRTWSALKTAVDQTWGGTESATKAEDLRRTIFSYFDGQSPNPKMTLYELEDNLGAYMEEEFGVVLEDESEREVADLIWRMYECCAKGDCALANQVVMDAIQAEELLKKSEVKSVIKNGDDDDDDDDDAMNDSSEEQEIGGDDNDDAMNSSSTTPKNEATAAAATAPTSALEYSQGYLFGGPPKPKKELPPPRQLGEAAPETPMPVIDDDGFAPVVTKKKGARR
ncbi:pre-rRNA-processing protein TSR2 [Skeletonema marinoi]|uniref:Pre-rRNA-processing protein TSR2 n=1 Tax=Skeletonema marinoi TaxID=267567 RepID=A0AAD8Y481_9STRA|nr:pre-rRNA-processing protein TSR2 [Skeletonema marinoi]